MKAANQAVSRSRSPNPPVAGSGFTLIEALIVVGIIAVLATLAAPGFTSLVATQRVRAVSTDIQMALVKARSEATKRDTNVTLSMKAGGWINGWQIVNPVDGSVLDDHGATTGVTIGDAPNSVIYQSSGRIQGRTEEIEFEIKSTALTSVVYCVEVDPSGRPKVQAAKC